MHTPAHDPFNYHIKTRWKCLYQFLINFTLSISTRQIFEVLKQRLYKKEKLILSKKSLKKYQKKDRDSEKVPYSKGSCSQLTFFNQPIIYSMFLESLWTIIITEERTQSIIVRSCCRTHVTLFLSGVWRSAGLSFISFCLLKREPITLYLTDLHYCRTVCKQKLILEKFDGKSTF